MPRQTIAIACLILQVASGCGSRKVFLTQSAVTWQTSQTQRAEEIRRRRREQLKTHIAQLQWRNVRVLLRNHELLEGIIESMDEGTFILRVDGQARRIAFDDIETVTEVKRRSKGALAAIVVGLGLAGFAILWLIMASQD